MHRFVTIDLRDAIEECQELGRIVAGARKHKAPCLRIQLKKLYELVDNRPLVGEQGEEELWELASCLEDQLEGVQDSIAEILEAVRRVKSDSVAD